MVFAKTGSSVKEKSIENRHLVLRCFVLRVTCCALLNDQLLYSKPFLPLKTEANGKIYPIPVVVSTQSVLDFYGDANEAAGHPLNFSPHLAPLQKALAWARGCQAPPEVTLSEAVKPEINHSHPSKAALHCHCDWAIWASAHCLHLSLCSI